MPLILIDSCADGLSVRSAADQSDIWSDAVALDAPDGGHGFADGRIGVLLEADRDPSELAPYLDGLAVVEIVWRKFTDGRGFSQVRQLREMGYGGQIRASGDILVDQVAFLARCGVDAVWFDPGKGDAVAMVQAVLEEIPVVYQKNVSGRQAAVWQDVFAQRMRAQ